ncbi:NADP-dependent dehydrogenase-like protein [Ilyonectria robusta]|uniref:NADP-dependent dehydrogenase-like protein n=1 Tax=Ilyonectria robusta TaxID=1079257 RepID=UPI001E8D55A6|nr:NADP-dependent dehydrogenase-like protein [Ilyonectria robusta]KAH8667807.1 NADP-dependent dehydrogenase-like protein [Ilyonectria robusta]
MAVFVITGARTGIGRETVLQLAKIPSNTVVAIVRNLQADLSSLNEIKASSNGVVHIVECDVSNPDSISQLVTRLAKVLGADFRVDVLIQYAAILHSREQTSTNLTAESLISHFVSNTVGPALVTQSLLPHLVSGAVITNITSGIGSLKMLTNRQIPAEITPYSISKTALNMLTVHQACQLGSLASVVIIDPGHVKTEMGGPNAVVEIPDSARGIIKIVTDLKPEDSGKFLLYNGTQLPW